MMVYSINFIIFYTAHADTFLYTKRVPTCKHKQQRDQSRPKTVNQLISVIQVVMGRKPQFTTVMVFGLSLNVESFKLNTTPLHSGVDT